MVGLRARWPPLRPPPPHHHHSSNQNHVETRPWPPRTKHHYNFFRYHYHYHYHHNHNHNHETISNSINYEEQRGGCHGTPRLTRGTPHSLCFYAFLLFRGEIHPIVLGGGRCSQTFCTGAVRSLVLATLCFMAARPQMFQSWGLGDYSWGYENHFVSGPPLMYVRGLHRAHQIKNPEE